MKDRLKLFFLVMVSTCVGLLFAEGLARVVFPTFPNVLRYNEYIEEERGKFCRYDNMLGWVGIENIEDEFEWLDCRHRVRQNRFGFRGSEYEFSRNKKKRLLVLGDSFVWGFGVEDDEIFTSIMEKRSDFSVEIVNMGVSGYGNDQNYLQWRQKGRLWKADEVILMVTWHTDISDNIRDKRYGYPKPVFKFDANNNLVLTNTPVPKRSGPWETRKEKGEGDQKKWSRKLFTHSAFANVFALAMLKNETCRNFMESNNIVPPRLAGYDWEYPFYLSTKNDELEKAYMILFKIIGMFNDDVKLAGCKLTVAIVPSVTQIYPKLWDEFRARSVHQDVEMDYERPNRRIVEWCQSKNIKVVDLLQGLKKAGESDPYLYYPINRHWTTSGHLVVADILLDELGIGNGE